jgi:ankyrin repeat protein
MSSKEGDTELICAVRECDYNKTEKLINEEKAYINERGRWGNTALHYAYNRGNIKIILLLLKNGANPYIQHDYGKTPENYSFIARNTYKKNEFEIEEAKNEYIKSIDLSPLQKIINIIALICYEIFVVMSFPVSSDKASNYIKNYNVKQITSGMTSDLYK